MDFDAFSGHRFENITGGEHRSAEEEGQEMDEQETAEQSTVAEHLSKSSQSHTWAAENHCQEFLSTVNLLMENVLVQMRIRLSRPGKSLKRERENERENERPRRNYVQGGRLALALVRFGPSFSLCSRHRRFLCS